ncbi:PQ-loop domain-containing transporter [Kribbella sp. NPDC003505]|uniref:PQ-loop domain-containing transporter n=1 Tax=Kribbella sp. NPDC003505 TaxID=3154448 RepID=UPI0033B211AC
MLDFLPVVAACFGIPQYLPQILKLRRTGDVAGVSWSWATLTCINNAAWFGYFMASGYWTASIPSTAASVLAGTVSVLLVRRGALNRGAIGWIAGWVFLLVVAAAVGGRIGLGTLLAAASIIQVTPSLWTAYRTVRPTGISVGTWRLVFGELGCWFVFGLWQSDLRLVTLGATGVLASSLMLARVWRAGVTSKCQLAA